jgi:sec-independent protein translocase protein TatA
MPDIGGPELIIILVVVLVLFGGSQLPKLARNLGQAQKEFKKGIDEGHKDDKGAVQQAAAPVQPVQAPPAVPVDQPAAATPAAPCPCGSGKDFASCHGANTTTA